MSSSLRFQGLRYWRSVSTIDSATTRLRYHLASAGTTIQGACGAAVTEIASSYAAV